MRKDSAVHPTANDADPHRFTLTCKKWLAFSPVQVLCNSCVESRIRGENAALQGAHFNGMLLSRHLSWLRKRNQRRNVPPVGAQGGKQLKFPAKPAGLPDATAATRHEQRVCSRERAFPPATSIALWPISKPNSRERTVPSPQQGLLPVASSKNIQSKKPGCSSSVPWVRARLILRWGLSRSWFGVRAFPAGSAIIASC